MKHLILNPQGVVVGATDWPDECGAPAGYHVLPEPVGYDEQIPEAVVLHDGYLSFDEAIALPALKQRLVREVDLVAKARRDAIVSHYSSAEMASWPIKRAEALLWQVTQVDTDAPALVMEAQFRGITLAALVQKVLDNAALLTQLEAAISGHCGRLQDEIRATTTLAQARAVNIHAGWPA